MCAKIDTIRASLTVLHGFSRSKIFVGNSLSGSLSPSLSLSRHVCDYLILMCTAKSHWCAPMTWNSEIKMKKKTSMIQQQEALTCVPYAYKGKFPTRHGTFACTSFNDKAKKVCVCMCVFAWCEGHMLRTVFYFNPARSVAHIQFLIQNKRCRESIENWHCWCPLFSYQSIVNVFNIIS